MLPILWAEKSDFRNTIIILTSNIGTRDLKDFGDGVGFGTNAKKSSSDARARATIENALKKAFCARVFKQNRRYYYLLILLEKKILRKL